MFKKLIYGAMLTSAAAATTVVVYNSLSNGLEQAPVCEVAFNANDGYFDGTNATELSYSVVSNTVVDAVPTCMRTNCDFVCWTNLNGRFVIGQTVVTNSVTNYASWVRSSVQKFNVKGGKYEARDTEKTGKVMQFPAVFLGEVESDPDDVVITFVSPTNSDCRISFDPQYSENPESRRVSVEVSIGNENGNASTNIAFGTDDYPVNFKSQHYHFHKDVKYSISLRFNSDNWGRYSNNDESVRKVYYALGIDLTPVTVKFNPCMDVSGKNIGRTIPKNCKIHGCNFSANYPFGYLPGAEPYDVTNYVASFVGWYKKPQSVYDDDEKQVTVNEIAGGITNVYAHWAFSNYTYHVAYDGVAEDVVGVMPGSGADVQNCKSGVGVELVRNRFYRRGYKFDGWDVDLGGTHVVYTDCQVVTNLCLIPDATATVYAVWHETSDNYFAVSGVNTNFTEVTLGTNIETRIAGTCEGTQVFTMDVTNITNSVECRVSIDPDEGVWRTNACLTVEHSSNGVWAVDCSTSDLPTNMVCMAFTNGTYRFTVSNAVGYAYVVGLNLPGTNFTFHTGGGKVETNNLSKATSFDWTIGSPVGYLPTLASDRYGNFLGWFKNFNLADTNDSYRVQGTESVGVTNDTWSAVDAYAHWEHAGYRVIFDPNGGYTNNVPLEAQVQDLYYDMPTNLTRNFYYFPGRSFLGWATNETLAVGTTLIYADQALVTNLFSEVGSENRLYAIWVNAAGTNDFYASDYGFTNRFDFVTNGVQTKVTVRRDSVLVFDVAAITNVNSDVRISLDPAPGFERSGSTLRMQALVADTNGVLVVNTNVSDVVVTDVSTNAVYCSITNGVTYRFSIEARTGATMAADYEFVVGINRAGCQFKFHPGDPDAKIQAGQIADNFEYDWSDGSPIGYLPKIVTGRGDVVSVWYASPELADTNRLSVSDLVSGDFCHDAYAHATNSIYYVRFNKGGDDVRGEMDVQRFYYDIPDWLNRNLFYCPTNRFLGWATNKVQAASNEWIYADQALVTNLCDKVGYTNTLYAVWKATPGTNEFVVGGSVTNFTGVTIKPGEVSTFDAIGSAAFQLGVTNMTAAVTNRVSIDPVPGVWRTNATLTVERMYLIDGTNHWTNVCSVTDLAMEPVYCAFTNGTYRFSINGVPGDDYHYKVGIGLPGWNFKFDPLGTKVVIPTGKQKGKTADSVTFNWSEGFEIGYLPSLSSTNDFGTFYGWYYDKDGDVTNRAVSVSNIVGSVGNGPGLTNTIAYAHWSNFVYYVEFKGKLPSCSDEVQGEMDVQALNLGVRQRLNSNEFYNPGKRFNYWVDRVSTNHYANGATVSNLCSRVGETNTLYAVWLETEGTNYYDVLEDEFDFGKIDLSGLDKGDVTLFVGEGESDVRHFYFEPAASTTSSVSNWTCRVSLDPDPEAYVEEREDCEECEETDYEYANIRCMAQLVIKRQRIVEDDGDEEEEEGEEEPEWEVVSTNVFDLVENEVRCDFCSGYKYACTVLFENGDGYNYWVGLGATGSQVVMEPCGGEVSTSMLTDLLQFNWTVGTPIGYLPELTSSNSNAVFKGWSYDPEVTYEEGEDDDDEEAEEDPGWADGDAASAKAAKDAEAEEDSDAEDDDSDADDDAEDDDEDDEEEEGWASDCKSVYQKHPVPDRKLYIYARWKGVNVWPVVFDGNMEYYGQPTNIVSTKYYVEGTKLHFDDTNTVKNVEYRDWGFLGWSMQVTNEVRKYEYQWMAGEFVVLGEQTFYAQWNRDWKTLPSSVADGVSVNGYNGTAPSPFAIPSTLSPNPKDGYVSIPPRSVVEIGERAFAGDAAVSGALTIPGSVRKVGDMAFASCQGIASVEFPSVMPASEYATNGFLEVETELGTNMFAKCISLAKVSLPLGVWRIPDGCFTGCRSLSEASLPYTLREIGVQAFSGCTTLKTIEIPENVATLESKAFRGCSRLKLVKFLGGQPSSAASDIFYRTQRSMLVAYFENMRSAASSYCGGDWPDLPGKWPTSSASNDLSRTLTWIGGSYPRRKINFNLNDGERAVTSTVVPYLCHAGRVFGFAAQALGSSYQSYTWYTQPVGGRRIGNYWTVPAASAGDSQPITVYAHSSSGSDDDPVEVGSRVGDEWKDGVSFEQFIDSEHVAAGDEEAIMSTTGGFYTSDDDTFYYCASSYDGLVIAGDAETNALKGTIVVTTAQGSESNGEMSAPCSAVITWTGNGGTSEFHGVVDTEGWFRAAYGQYSLNLYLTKSGVNGYVVDSGAGATYRVIGARDRTSMDSDAAATIVLTSAFATRGTWHVVLKPSLLTATSDDFRLDGYCTFSIAISDLGAATIQGSLADGTKVATSSKLIIGDCCCCLPVTVAPYSGLSGFSFVVWFTWKDDGSLSIDDESTTVRCLTEWDGTHAMVPFTASWAEDQLPVTFIDDQLYEGESDFTSSDVEAKVSMTNGGKTWVVSEGNGSGLNLSFDYVSGIFYGSVCLGGDGFASVSGVFTDRIEDTDDGCVESYEGYGSAYIYGKGSWSVKITTDGK